MDQQFFDKWANDYDADVAVDGEFPFDGYERTLDEVCHVAQARPGMTILDVATGTGNLAQRFVALECDVLATDFSPNMLAEAEKKIPHARFVLADLAGTWPPEMDKRFDRIVAGYVLHEFELSDKVTLLERFAKHHLTADGFIIIADIGYLTAEKRQTVADTEGNGWDPSEFYWAADETIAECAKVGLTGVYKQTSSCAGIYVFKLSQQ